MKRVYPAVISPDKDSFLVYIPTLDIYTQGLDVEDAIFMARDVIGIYGISKIEAGEELPESVHLLPKVSGEDIATLIDIDLTEYKQAYGDRLVRKNLTIPNWLNTEAEKKGINFSQLLQSSLKEVLGINE